MIEVRLCPYCKSNVDEYSIKCQICNSKLKTICKNCHKIINTDWKECPNCLKIKKSKEFQKPELSRYNPNLKRETTTQIYSNSSKNEKIMQLNDDNFNNKIPEAKSKKQIKRSFNRNNQVRAICIIILSIMALSIFFMLGVPRAERYYEEGVKFFYQENYEDAANNFQKALEIDQNHKESITYLTYTWHKMGLLHLNRSEYDLAIEYFEKAIETPSDYNPPLFYKGVSLFELERHSEAIEIFYHYLELVPKDDEAIDYINKSQSNIYFNEALGFYTKRMYEEAIILFEKAIEYNPDNMQAKAYMSDLLHGRALGFYTKRMYEEAIILFEKAIEHNPDNIQAKLYLSYTWKEKGDSFRDAGRYSEAIICYDNVLEINPSYKEAWNGKGISLLSLGIYSEALYCFNQALLIDPKYPSALFYREVALSFLRTR